MAGCSRLSKRVPRSQPCHHKAGRHGGRGKITLERLTASDPALRRIAEREVRRLIRATTACSK
jgi:hypothetical protein